MRAHFELRSTQVLALGAEVVSFANSGKYHIIATGELWFDLHPGSLNLSQAVIQCYLHPWL